MPSNPTEPHTAFLFLGPNMPSLVRSSSFLDSILRPAWPSSRGFAYLGQGDQRGGDTRDPNDSIITANLVKQDASRSCTIYLSTKYVFPRRLARLAPKYLIHLALRADPPPPFLSFLVSGGPL